MRRRQPIQFAPTARPCAPGTRLVRVLVVMACLFALSGCNSFGNARLVKELQSENERLLTEFRGQRDRATELEKANRLQADRLAESEKLLARLSQGSGAGRLSSLPQASLPTAGLGGLPPGRATNLPGNSNPLPPAQSPPSELRWQPRYDSRP